MLVTRLPDRRALARLLRAALRHEIAQVQLVEPPRQGTHTLDLRVPGEPSVSLLAEPAGAMQNGQFPLRLRPLHRAQAAELYALLEGENPPSETAADTAAPGSPPPDTIAQPPRTISYEDSGPILRAMSGSAPPPVGDVAMPKISPIDPRVTARMDWGLVPSPAAPAPAPAMGAIQGLPVDPRRTAPSAVWTPPVGDATLEDPRGWAMAAAGAELTGLPDDPRRTARSASWAPPAIAAAAAAAVAHDDDVVDVDESDLDNDGHGADDPSLSVSVVFEPDMLPGAVAAATAAAIAAAKREAAEAEEEPLPADLDGPSLSVSVIFEPDMLPMPPSTTPDLAPASVDVPISAPISEAVPQTPTMAMAEPPIRGDEPGLAANVPTDDATEAQIMGGAGGASDFFFDEDFANMPMALPGEGDEASRAQRLSEAPPTEGSVPVFTPRTAAQAGATDHDSLRGVPPPPDDDDDADTLIRLPGAPSGNMRAGRAAPVPAAGMLAEDDARTGMPPPIVSRAARAREELTPTQSSAVVQEAIAKKQTTGSGGRKKKSTHGGKSATGGEKKRKKPTRHPADGEAHTQEAAFSAEEIATNRRSKPDQAETTEADPLIGRKIAEGKYTIEAAIGAGAAGAVYKAMHRELRRTVGIKVLHPHYQKDPHFMKSFRGEALAASQLDHPNVMRVLDFGQEPDGLVYIVMEFLSGRTLQSLLDEERRLQTDRAVEIMIQVCAALSVAHDNGIIHRDIKPDNIMLVPSRNDEGGSFELV
ncbi:MAG: Serine/threonine protein kinase PrkC, regulator of stationary phase, partial [Myxococcaceae bacterium]|nr:Serine/threonine protein kinase PrkC, regulator of stationary phase [Myxococcaceae bacterium]